MTHGIINRTSGFTILPILLCAAICNSAIPLPTPPIIPNYNRIPIGQIEASEAGAYVARASGITATWYNPAGLGLTQNFALNASYNGLELMKFRLKDFSSSLRSLTIDVTPGFLGVVAKLPLKSPKPISLSLALSQPVLWQTGFDAITQTESRSFKLSIFNDVYFTSYYPSMAAGFTVNNKLRFGLGLSFPYSSLDINQTFSGHPESEDPVDFLLSFQANGTILHLAFSAGLQFQLTDNILFGAMFRTPGIMLFRSAWIYYDLLKYSNDTTISVSLRDTSAVFNYKQPAQFTFGLSYTSLKWSVELDFNLYQGFGKYTVLRSDDQAISESFNPAEGTTISYRSFPQYFYHNETVINAALGGDYRINEHLSLQAGFCTDFSPVNPHNSNIFRSIDLFNITIGASTSFRRFTGALGFRFNFGSSDSYITGKELLENPIRTRLIFRSFSLIWAITLGS